MAKLLDRAVLLDDLAWKIFPHSALPKGEPVCNVSDETNAWNRAALDYAWKTDNPSMPRHYAKPISTEEMLQMERTPVCNVSDETNAWNRLALGYSN